MKIRIITIAAVGTLAICVFAQETEKSLSQRFKDVSNEVAEAQKLANKSNDEMWAYKDKIVYSNEVLYAVYKEMKEHEKQMLVKKQQIEDEIKKLPEYRDLLKKQEETFKKLRQLTDRQEEVRKEIERKKSAKIPVEKNADGEDK